MMMISVMLKKSLGGISFRRP